MVKMFNRAVLVVVLFFSYFVCFAQVIDGNVLNKAKHGDPESMYQVALTYDKQGNDNSYKEGYSWALKAAEADYAPAKALVGYHYFKGIGVQKDWAFATLWAYKAFIEKGDGLGCWVMQQTMRENIQEFKSYVQAAYKSHYPVADLYFAKLYYSGSEEYGISKDESKALELIDVASKYGIPYTDAIRGLALRSDGHDDAKVFKLLNSVTDLGIAKVYSQLASMFHNGSGTAKDEKQAFAYYEKAAGMGDYLGIEGLADFYRIGIAVAQDQEKAYDLYRKVADYSPRASYLTACYLNEGVGTGKDEVEALRLFQKSAELGYAFAQAYLGIALYTGTSPYRDKDVEKASKYLLSAIDNPGFEELPDEIKSRVYEFGAACCRYGFGASMNVEKADKLFEKANSFKIGLSLARPPFGFVGALTSEEAAVFASNFTPNDIPDEILDYTILDYPKDIPGEESEEEVLTLSFSDSELEKVLTERFDKSGDGLLTKDELKDVSSLEGLKLENKLTSFNELAYFTSITEIPQMFFQGFGSMVSVKMPESIEIINSNAFLGCSSLKSIEIPASVSRIGDWAFASCVKLNSLVCEGETPPSVGESFLAYSNDVVIYVPAAAVDSYKKATGWKSFAKRIKAIPVEK